MREEGHYTIKRVKKLPEKGNANWLYTIIDNKIEKFYRWLPNKTYEEITLGAAGVTNTSQLINDGENGTDPFITINDLEQYTLSPISGTNMMNLLKDGLVVSTIDLTPYLDDTNLARLVSGVVIGTDLIVTRDDSSTFTIDVTTLIGGAIPTGLEKLDEGNGDGWRLIGTDPTKYGSIGQLAVDFSANGIFSLPSTVRGATGFGSFAIGAEVEASGGTSFAGGNRSVASGTRSFSFGDNTVSSNTQSISFGILTTSSGQSSFITGTNGTASGTNSFGMGSNGTASGTNSLVLGSGCNATGDQSIAGGNNSTASGNNSLSQGVFCNASGEDSTALGRVSKSPSFGEMSVGIFGTTYVPISTTSHSPTDRVFNVGNGVNLGFENDAFTVLKGGEVLALDLTTAKIDAADPKVLVTKEWHNSNLGLVPSGLEAINEGNGIGWRLIGSNVLNHGDIGNHAIDLTFQSSASTTRGATGFGSIALGFNTEASGGNSLAAQSGVATGTGSIALGIVSQANDNHAVAIGNGAIANGRHSGAFGFNIESSSWYEFNVGANNIIKPVTTGFNVTDVVFNVGNGSSAGARSDAFTIYKNGGVLFHPTTTPTNPTAGMVYFDSTTNKLRCFDGAIWNDMF